MGFFDFFKSESKENYISPEEIEQMEKDYSSTKSDISFEDFVASLDLSDLNKVRNLIDKREEELTGEKLFERKVVEEKPKVEEEKEKTGDILRDEIEFIGSDKDEVSKEEIEEVFIEEPEKEEVKEEKVVETKFEEDKDLDKEVESFDKSRIQRIYSEIGEIFGEENTLIATENACKYENLKGKEVVYIGVRKKDEIGNEDALPQVQNSWFISNVKKLSELQNFKVLDSSESSKDLVWFVDDKNAVMICFRATNLLENEESFNFPL